MSLYKKDSEKNLGKDSSPDLVMKEDSSITIFSKHYKKSNGYEDVSNAAV